MMTTKRIRNFVAAGWLCCGIAAALTSCENIVDYDEGYIPANQIANSGAPTITAVYAIDDTERQTAITEAAPGQTVQIVGQNLNNLRQLKFNTVEADVANTYTMSTRAVVTLPKTFSKEHKNLIEYTTDQGTATFSFAVTLPKVAVDGLSNEFAAAGSTVTVSGSNFSYYDMAVSVGGQNVSLTQTTDTLLTFVIPAGTADDSTVKLSWTGYDGAALTATLPFRPVSALLFADLSQTVRQKTDRNVSIETGSLGTPCLHFTGEIRQWAWVELSFAQSQTVAYEASAVSQYNFVFELMTAAGSPLLGKGYEFAWNWDWNNSYRWQPGNGKGLDTAGEWTTVRCPLETVAANGVATVDGTLTLNIGFQPAEDYEADFRLANFRIEKK